jgi:phosphoglucomutase
VLTLPKTNMIFLCLEANGLVIVRPSGTEPKIKVYYTTVGKTFEEADALQKKIAADITGLFK